jgi:UDP-GlcNAc3NAcA epimerase
LKIITVVGARPQFVKAAALSRAISCNNSNNSNSIQEIIIHTGQHYDKNMSDVFFEEMRIPAPDYNLGVGGKKHGEMTGQMVEKLEQIVETESPDWLVVYGDTNSTLAAAIVSSKMNVKLAHIEAGLRSYNMKMPEEVNRILTDRVSDILFCPTQTAVDNLRKESFPFVTSAGKKQRIVNVGDVMQDGALFYKDLARTPEKVVELVGENSFALCTIHRAENTDSEDRLTSIMSALGKISDEKPIILPVHPRTKKILESISLKINPNIKIIDPVGYLEMIWLLKNCNIVLTDSGGLQKEAYFFSKPCITLREETEWVELVDAGVNTLAGSDCEEIYKAYCLSIQKKFEFNNLNLYGDGKACERIVEELLK